MYNNNDISVREGGYIIRGSEELNTKFGKKENILKKKFLNS